ncbi:MAG TPA: energy transducer TonB, partial [Vicinamibacterales bacterium]
MKALALAAAVVFGGAVAAQEPVYTKKDQVSYPTVLVDKKPAYTKAAMEKKIQGVIELSTVVDTDGTPTDV